MKFEWDDAKATTNIEKHGVSFEEAVEVFYDPKAIEKFDVFHSAEEDRFVLIGLSSRRLLSVVYAERENEIIRIISARKATKLEQNEYEQG